MQNAKVDLILVPGTLCDAMAWQYQIEHLSDIARPAVPDLRGYDSLADMAAMILERAPPKFALAGHSMGGRIALEIVRVAADRVETLALLDTTVTPKQAGEDERRARTVACAREQGMDALLATWIPQIIHPDRTRDMKLVKELTAMMMRFTPEDVARQNQAMLTRADLVPVVSTIACPVMLLCGRQDRYSPLERHQEMLAMISRGSLSVIEDCGHMSTMERPEAVTRLMREWLTAPEQNRG